MSSPSPSPFNERPFTDREWMGDATPTDPRAQRNRAGRRGGHVLTRALSPPNKTGLPTLLHSQRPCPGRSHRMPTTSPHARDEWPTEPATPTPSYRSRTCWGRTARNQLASAEPTPWRGPQVKDCRSCAGSEVILDSIASRIASVAEANAGPFFNLQVLDEPPRPRRGLTPAR